MNILSTLNQLLEQIINTILGRTGPVSPSLKIVFIITFFFLLYLLSDFLAWLINEPHRLSKSKAKSRKSTYQEKESNGPLKKFADLFYYELEPANHTTSGFQRTGRGLRGLYLAEKPSGPHQPERGLLVIRFNSQWFFFKNPKALAPHEIEIFEDEKRRQEKATEPLDFFWASFFMKVIPKYTACYQVEIEGHYPHLIQHSKQVSLLLTKFKDQDLEEDDQGDRYFLFEEIGLTGGISWQNRKIYLWEGDKLTDQEISEVKRDYFEQETEVVEFDVEMMR